MKKMLLLLGVLALAVVAPAQQQINFADMPLVATPGPMPLGYASLNWGNFWYVDPSQYSGAGPGYKNLFTHKDVVFIGGQFCGAVKPGCYGVITSYVGMGSFMPVGAVVAAGYTATQITVLAYNHGNYVGSVSYNLSTMPHMVNFPAWGSITELQIQTDSAGNLVLLDLIVYPTV